MQLDIYDQRILHILQEDARISNHDLAQRVFLSPAPCLERVRALEDSGLITGYHTILNAKVLGLTLMALVFVAMDRHTPERFRHFERQIVNIPEVLECLLITGQDADYQLKVVVRDMEAYQMLLLDRIAHIDGVSDVKSSFVLQRVVDKTSLPIEKNI